MQQLEELKKYVYHNNDFYISDKIRKIINIFAYPELIRCLISEVTHPNIVNYLQLSISKFEI